uniref:Uncharacterized protein n=1 Tax=Panagrolaimus sp. PS1159 TaxID=55785 RepID=A0AC35F884_9BILA
MRFLINNLLVVCIVVAVYAGEKSHGFEEEYPAVEQSIFGGRMRRDTDNAIFGGRMRR